MSLYEIYKAKKLGYADDYWTSAIGHSLGGYKWISTDYEQTPYIYRAMPNLSHYYNREIMDAVVGGSVAWNQLVGMQDSTFNLGDVTFTKSNGKVTATGTANVSIVGALCYVQIVKDHKYLLTNYPQAMPISSTNAATLQVYALNVIQLQINEDDTSCAKIGMANGTGESAVRVRVENGNTYNLEFYPQLFDLTQMFGSTIADYIYSLEQATAGSGVAWLKQHFPKMFGQYNPYDAGSIQSVSGLVSHDTVGFNQFDKSTITDNSYISGSTGDVVSGQTEFFCSDFIKCLSSTEYYSNADVNGRVYTHIFFDADKNFVGRNATSKATFTTPSNAYYMRVNAIKVKVAAEELCINLHWDGSRDGEYEPYQKWSYPLDSDLTLRGIPKLDASNNLYYDGDVYEADGTVTRKYGIVNLGTLAWAYSSSVQVFYSTNFNTAYMPKDDSRFTANAVCGKYVTTNRNYIADHSSEDKLISLNYSDTKYVTIRDTAYSDATVFKNSLSGVYLVYELATPTTETADPYTKTQNCDSGGTEEFVTNGIVSVGHKSKYAEK